MGHDYAKLAWAACNAEMERTAGTSFAFRFNDDTVRFVAGRLESVRFDPAVDIVRVFSKQQQTIVHFPTEMWLRRAAASGTLLSASTTFTGAETVRATVERAVQVGDRAEARATTYDARIGELRATFAGSSDKTPWARNTASMASDYALRRALLRAFPLECGGLDAAGEDDDQAPPAPTPQGGPMPSERPAPRPAATGIAPAPPKSTQAPSAQPTGAARPLDRLLTAGVPRAEIVMASRRAFAREPEELDEAQIKMLCKYFDGGKWARDGAVQDAASAIQRMTAGIPADQLLARLAEILGPEASKRWPRWPRAEDCERIMAQAQASAVAAPSGREPGEDDGDSWL